MVGTFHAKSEFNVAQQHTFDMDRRQWREAGQRSATQGRRYLRPSVQRRFTERPPPEDPDRNVMQLLLFAIKRAGRRSLADDGSAAQI